VKRLAVLLLLLASLTGCLSPQQARTANAVLNGVACGVAAAQETPCTPQAVLDALARDAAAQQAKVAAVVLQAAAVDPAVAQAIVEQLAANTASNKALTKALLDLATRPAPLPQYPLTNGPMPPLPPPRTPPVLPVPERDTDPQGVIGQ
jgi:hypothetical protein